MIQGLEALIALERTGTVSEAAAQLRLTQSAVSKRIQALQEELGFAVIQPDGRRVRITERGQSLIDKARPLLSEIKNLGSLETGEDLHEFSIGVSDSIAASWGPKLIRLCQKKLKSLKLDLHVHRSTLVEENVKLGRYQLGLCIDSHSPPESSTLISATTSASSTQLVAELIAEEPMVFLYNRFDPESDSERMITIEPNSATWKAISEKVVRHTKLKNYQIVTVESFAAIVRMVEEGFGHGLVPLGIATTMGAPKKASQILIPSVRRPIKLISRKSIALLPQVKELTATLREVAREMQK